MISKSKFFQVRLNMDLGKIYPVLRETLWGSFYAQCFALNKEENLCGKTGKTAAFGLCLSVKLYFDFSSSYPLTFSSLSAILLSFIFYAYVWLCGLIFILACFYTFLLLSTWCEWANNPVPAHTIYRFAVTCIDLYFSFHCVVVKEQFKGKKKCPLEIKWS